MDTWESLENVNCDNLDVALALCLGVMSSNPQEDQRVGWILEYWGHKPIPLFTCYLFDRKDITYFCSYSHNLMSFVWGSASILREFHIINRSYIPVDMSQTNSPNPLRGSAMTSFSRESPRVAEGTARPTSAHLQYSMALRRIPISPSSTNPSTSLSSLWP